MDQYTDLIRVGRDLRFILDLDHHLDGDWRLLNYELWVFRIFSLILLFEYGWVVGVGVQKWTILDYMSRMFYFLFVISVSVDLVDLENNQ